MEVDVLSVVAAHILTLQQAVAESAERFSQFTLEGTNVRLDKTCALFITMNPRYDTTTQTYASCLLIIQLCWTIRAPR